MNSELCQDLIYFLDRDQSLACGHAPQPVSDWLETLQIPMNLRRFMQWHWPQNDCGIAHLDVKSSASIHSDEATAPLLRDQFLNIGSAPNGDWFVIDFSNDACACGYISHGEWSPWEDEPVSGRAFYQMISRSLESFLHRAVESRYLPTDYYSAKAFNEFLAEEKSSDCP